MLVVHTGSAVLQGILGVIGASDRASLVDSRPYKDGSCAVPQSCTGKGGRVELGRGTVTRDTAGSG